MLAFAACFLLTSALSWAAVRFVPAFKGLLAITLPLVFAPVFSVAGFYLAEVATVCEPQPALDCATLMSFATGLAAFLFGGGAMVGAVVGGALAWKDYRNARTTKAAHQRD
ncbi:hypothetical protein [Caulobacter sp. NIBR1757]|uniref:hypothetical protein n=1 Tax=Caulobacter sp. NIBR1757 TaxID=3016000 RepID=UPI0022F0E193|nr:hypothetical protein [Caulobacter sp. NIBR1757]WGM39159.1 hypothetical protein AMEJIAPC_02073 [Caulobacter sp. NIBR1757]